MNIDKGNTTLNYIFGAFIALSTLKIGAELYQRYSKSKQPAKSCGCGKK